MTLFRQVAFLVSLAFLLLLAVFAWSDFRQSSKFLQGEMQSAAQDMATTLGITVANSVADGDAAAIDTLFNAVFDSGYYSRVELVSMEGATLHAKEQQVLVRDVPQWFIDLVPLVPATGSSQIMKGWLPYGQLSITLHPGYAYASLYENLKSTLPWFGLVAGAGLAALWWLLHLVMKPLETVRRQAEAIQENRFIRQEPLPKTRELRQVADAMNRMVGKVQVIFDAQTEALQRYHDVLYQDALTGLGNRRYFVTKLNDLCRDESAYRGWLVMVCIHGLEDVNRRQGRQVGDELITTVGRLLEAGAGLQGREYCVRMNAGEFAAYLDGTAEAADQYLRQVFHDFQEWVGAKGLERVVWLCCGLTPVEGGAQASGVLSDVDFALAQAKALGPYGIYRNVEYQSALPQGKMQWRAWLEDSVSSGRFFLVAQPVHNRDRSVYHHELFVRLRDEQNRVIPASVFMPVAASLGLELAIDRAVFGMALGLRNQADSDRIALNLSGTFLSSADALAEFERFVKRYMNGARPPLCVEVSHFALLQHREAAEHIAELLRAAGCFFGIDRLDLGNALRALQVVRPHYVKIGARQLADMAEDRVLGAFQALRTLASSLDIQLIAVGVDSAELHETLARLGVDAMQGNYLGVSREVA